MLGFDGKVFLIDFGRARDLSACGSELAEKYKKDSKITIAKIGR